MILFMGDKEIKQIFCPEKIWDTIIISLLTVSISSTIISFFLSIPDHLVSFFYILLFTSFLASDKMGGKTIDVDSKAFYYFGSYIFLFMILVDYTISNSPGKFILISSGGLLVIGIIVLWQVMHFSHKAPTTKRRLHVAIFGLLAFAILLSYCLINAKRV